MTKDDGTPARVRWARLRFQIIGPLLASPPETGELGPRLDELASKTYVHPSTGLRVRFECAVRSGEVALRLENVRKSFGEKDVYRDLDLEILRAELTLTMRQMGTPTIDQVTPARLTRA